MRSAVLLLLLAAVVADAAPLIWDADPATPGVQDGGGAWDDSATNWWDGTANTNWTSANPDDATFGAGGTPGTVTLAGPISVGNLTFTDAYTVTGSVLTLASPSIVTATAAGVIGSVLADGSLVKEGAADLTLSSSNSFAGGLTVRAGRVVLGDDAAAGGGTIALDGGAVLRDVAGAVVTNAVAVGSSGTLAGRLVVDAYMTFAGPLSGGGPLTITGLVTLANAGNSYTGAVAVPGGNSFLRLAVSDALTNNPITLGNANANLTLNGGTTSTVGSLSGSAGRIFNQSALPATLFIGAGNQSGIFGGRVGNGGGPMHIVKLGTGTQEFSTASASSETYASLFVQGGLLRLNGGGYPFNTTGGNGSGTPITVAPGATLEIAAGFNAGHSRLLNIAGGTLRMSFFEGPPGNDGGNYMNNIALSDGAQVTGNRIRVGNFSGATLAVTGATASTLAAGINMVVAAGGLPLTLNVEDVTGSAAADLTISGPIGDFTGLGGMPLVKTGPGSILITASNSYAGGTTIAQGALLLRHPNALGASASPVLLGAAATGTNAVELALAHTAGDLGYTRAIAVTTNGSGVASIGGRHTGGRAFFDGPVTLQRDATLLGAGADRTQFRGGIVGTGNVTIAGGSRVTWSTTAGTTEFGNGASLYTFFGAIGIAGTGTILQLNSDFVAGGQSLASHALNVGSGAFLRLPYDADTVIGALSGTGLVEAFAPGGGAPGNVFTVGADGGSASFDGRLINTGGATLRLVKTGAGTQTLTGTNTYTGTTDIQAGTLALAGLGAISNSPVITVATGAVFDFTAGGFTLAGGRTLQGGGLVTGVFAALAGASLVPGGTGAVDTLSFGGSVVLDAGVTSHFDLAGGPAATCDQVRVVGDLTPGGSVVRVAPLGPLVTGVFPIATYTGLKTGAFNPVVAGAGLVRQALSLDETGTPQQVNLVVAGGSADLVWTGTGTTWDVATSTNWLNSGSLLPDVFLQGDRVRFDDTAATGAIVQLGGALLAGAVTVAADTNAFAFAGPGALGGVFTLTKSGTNALAIATTNTFSGATIVSNGTIIAGANAAFGSSAVTLAGGTVLARAGAAGTIGNTIALESGVVAVDDAGGTLALTNAIAGAGGMLKRGAGTVTLGAANGFAGGVTVAAGTLAAGSIAALGTGPALVTTGAVLVAGIFAVTNPVTLAGGTLAVNGGVTYTMPITLEAGGTNILRAAGNYAAFAGAIGGAGGLWVAGTGVPGVQLANPGNSFLGGVSVAGGAFLRLTASEVIPDSAVVGIESNGNLRLEGGGLTETIAGLDGTGQVWIPTSGTNHTLRVGAGDVSSAFGGSISPTNQGRTVTLVKIGAGSFTLDGVNHYTGPTAVEAGTLAVNGYTDTGVVTVAAAATLGGTGVVGGVVMQDGTISPGPGLGTLVLSNDCAAGGTAVLHFELGGTNDYDRLIVAGTHTMGGTVRVVTTNGYAPASGDTFVLVTNLSASLIDVVAAWELPALAAGLGWSRIVDVDDLTLSVTGTVASATPYDLWAQSITNPALRGEQEDADGDGSPNLLEYSQGSDATNAADSAKLVLVRSNGQFLAVFNRVNTATDIVYEVEGAYAPTNGASWLGIATNLIGSWGSSTNVNDDNTAAVHRVLVTDLELGTNRTLRLKITRP
jgi:fibronectin-binding autotransporter adhesin